MSYFVNNYVRYLEVRGYIPISKLIFQKGNQIYFHHPPVFLKI